MRTAKCATTSDHARPVRLWLVALALFVGAMATRGFFLWASPDRTWPHSTCFEGDGPLWARFAASLQRGESFEFDLPIHTPGMAYFLSWIWNGRMDAGFVTQKLLLAVLGSLSCVLIWAITRLTFGERVAILAGLLSAASFAATVQATSLNNETPYTFLLLLICAGTLRLAARRSVPLLAAVAILNGLAVLFRAEHTLLFIMLAVYLLGRWRRAEQAERAAENTTAPRKPKNSPAKARPNGRDDQSQSKRNPGLTNSLIIMIAGFFLVPLPWNIRSYRAIQRFNTVEPRPVRYEAARLPWTPQAIEFVRGLPAFAREGNFLLLTDLAASRGIKEVSREFVEDWFNKEAGYVPRPLSPHVFVSSQGPLSFAFANNPLANGGFSTRLLDPFRASKLAFGNPKHLELFQQGYTLGMQYLTGHPRDALRLFGAKLAIFVSGLTQGLTPLDFPLEPSGIRRPADQMGPMPGTGRAWAALILALAGIGLVACMKHRVGGICLLVVAYKTLVAVAFYGYVREAVSILPFFFVFVAAGVDTIAAAPLIRKWPRLERSGRPLVMLCTLALIAISAAYATHSPRYDVSGSVDATPLWGPGAFESCQQLIIRQTK